MDPKQDHNSEQDSSIHSLLGDLGLRAFSTLRTIQVPSRSQQAKELKLAHEAALYDLPLHMERLENSAQTLNLRSDFSSLKQQIKDELTLKLGKYLEADARALSSDIKIRIVVSPNSLNVHFSEYNSTWENLNSITLKTCSIERALPEHKTTSSAPSVVARKTALVAGHDEALLIDRDGIVRETAWANIFWVNKDQTICSTKNNILPGTTRRIILNECEVLLCDCPLEEFLKEAQEVFVTQATTGVTAVRAIDDVHFEAPGPQTQMIQQLFVQQQMMLAERIAEF